MKAFEEGAWGRNFSRKVPPLKNASYASPRPYGSAVRVLEVPDCNRQYLSLETIDIP